MTHLHAKLLTPLALSAALLGLASLLAGCGAAGGEQPHGPPLFTLRAPSETGVTFANELPETADFNILNYLYYYDGGGVAAGDVNGDGRPDLYFTSNLDANRLYLNRGHFQFEDVTDAAGVAGTGSWTTGATMADVNGDGRLDLYVSAVNHLGKTGKNQLLINQGVGEDGIPTFTDEAPAYGLDFAGYSTQAAFFDYDRDGDLDVYLLNHALHTARSYRRAHTRTERDPKAGDQLLRNDEGHFTDVSEAAGIYGGAAGYGLSVSVSDLNRDGWPDLYVANDFHENDFLYLNQHDGTFRETLEESAGHTSQASMGTDAADVNGDGWPDLAVLDMLPAEEAILKTSASAEPYDVYRIKRRYGYHPQLNRNTLQLNRGGAPATDSTTGGVRFSEIGALSGVEATDWSWSTLFADLDLDGRQDLFITNGIYRRPNDLDYVNYASNPAIQASLEQGITQENLSLLELMPQVPISNAAFRNGGQLTFTNEAAAWGLDHEGFSNGAAYADLDGDGDLDLVTNNIGEAASIYENHAAQRTGRHFLTVELKGRRQNTAGLGALVQLWQGKTMQLREQNPVRGWQSSVAPRLHFGLGADSTADSLTVVWPDGRFQTLRGVPGDQVLTLRQAAAAGAYPFPGDAAPPPLFEDVTVALGLDPLRHEENAFIDFNRDALLPHKLSTEGPALAVGDVNGDGLDDAYLGGAKHQPGRLLVQQPDGRFAQRSAPTWSADRLHEDTDAAFFDADSDGHLDLYVVSGGAEFWGAADALRDRLYLGDGAGHFRRAKGALPDAYENGAVVAPADYDGDGDTDLFVGSRLVANAYGATPPSFLLENDGDGHFTDVTGEKAEGLSAAGMVTDAAWADLGGDGGPPDLVVVGEWMPVRVFLGRPGRLTEGTEAAGLGASQGWWNAVTAADLDGDGDTDLALGNLGLNTRLEASAEAPARLYVRDFDGNGSADPILTYYRDGASYPMATRDELVEQIGPLRQKFPTYTSFGAAQLEDLFTPEQIAGAEVRTARTFATSIAENDGDGAFTLRALSPEAQFAPVYALLPGDFDGDGRTDLVLGGNFYGVKPALGRYDASYGLFLRGTGEDFAAVPPRASGLWLTGEVRALKRLRSADGATLLLVARNDASWCAVRVRPNAGALAELK